MYYLRYQWSWVLIFYLQSTSWLRKFVVVRPDSQAVWQKINILIKSYIEISINFESSTTGSYRSIKTLQVWGVWVLEFCEFCLCPHFEVLVLLCLWLAWEDQWSASTSAPSNEFYHVATSLSFSVKVTEFECRWKQC